MDTQATALTIPPPEELERQIATLNKERKALMRLLRLSRCATVAKKANAERRSHAKAVPA